MNRRNFIKFATMAVAGSTVLFVESQLLATDNQLLATVVFGNQPELLLNPGLKLFGGIESFIKKRQRVVLKPDISHNRKPGEGFTSNPILVKRIIEQCYQGGAKIVTVFDHTTDEWTKCYKNSGIERLAKDAGARVEPAADLRYFINKSAKKTISDCSLHFHNSMAESDVFINVALVNTHGEHKLSAGIANLAGCVWERKKPGTYANRQFVAEILKCRQPDLTILEVWLKPPFVTGKTQNSSSLRKALVISKNAVLADVIAARLLNVSPQNVTGLSEAVLLKTGTFDYPGTRIITLYEP